MIKNQMNNITKTLEMTDWDFINAKTNTTTHSFHPYPAKFIPQIPRKLIEVLSTPGDCIYDPFLGSGTTAVEANILGRNANGNDVNELAVLISKVKTTPILPDELKTLDVFLNQCRSCIEQLYSQNHSNKIDKPKILNLDKWFEDYVINELVVIKEQIKTIDDVDLRDFCLVALSGIIVNVSRQDSDTRYVRVPKDINHFDTFIRFEKQIKKLRKHMLASHMEISNGFSEFKIADTRVQGIFPDNSAQLAITSPPYPNAYDYHLYHKYRLFWLDMNPNELRENEIGAHAYYSKKNGLNEFDFVNDMEKSFFTTSNILVPGSYFAIVIGNSILKGRTIRNNLLLKEMSKKTPFIFIREFSRNICLSKKSFNPVIGNIKKEYILLFKNNK